MNYFIGQSFPPAQPDEGGLPGANADVNPVSTNRYSLRKIERMMKELASLNEDNAGKSERDRNTIWRKLQKYISSNDNIANEYV